MQDIIAKARAFVGRMIKKARSFRKDAVEETEEIIREAETEETFVSVTVKETAKRLLRECQKRIVSIFGKLSSRERMLLLFAVAVVLGFAAKTAANEYIVIGYRDYTAKNTAAYNLIELQKRVADNGGAGILAGSNAQPGGSCSQ